MQLGDFPLGQGDDGDACELQVLVECRDIRLIPADAIQCLGNDHREQARAVRLAPPVECHGEE